MHLDADKLRTLSQLLDQALDLPQSERAAWLSRLEEQYAAVKPMLQQMLFRPSAAETADFLETLPRFSIADETSSYLGAGSAVGPYRLLRELGRGGMGEVWLAERADGLFERPVALKLPAMALPQRTLAERFAREREILAPLNHPHIARLYEAGFADDGQPYLALEYVEGAPITTHCDTVGANLRARIELFLQALSAVQYAHKNLVLHRDLKPSNILVTPDGDVKLLDFGIAKLMEEGEARESELTRLGGRALTLEYASPEQINGDPITIASDVYSLGVVLYTLLCGNRPYRLKRESRGALEEAILNVDPVRPSQTVITGDIASARASTVNKLRRALAGDLDTIVAKALKKDAGERYATVDAFAVDLGHFLAGEPVLARRASAAYRIRKFVVRNRLGVTVALLVGVALSTSTAVSLWQARAARDQASVAQRQSVRAQAVQEFLLDLFRANSDMQPDPIKARQTTARELLDIGAQRVGERLKDTPDVAAEVLDTLADMYAQVGLDDEAANIVLQQIAALKKAYGPSDPRVADALLTYAGTVFSTNERERAVPALNEAMEILDGAHDYTSVTRGIVLTESARAQMYDSVTRMRDRAAEAAQFFRDHHPEHGRLIGALRLLGRARFWMGDYQGSEAAFAEALAKENARETQNWSTVITLLVELAETQVKLVKLDDAEHSLRRALAETRKRNGDLHVDTVHVETRLGAFLHATSRRAEGRLWLASAWRKLGEAPGADSPGVAAPVQMNYAVGLVADGRLDEARPLLLAGVEYQRRHFAKAVAAANAIRNEGAEDVVLGRYDEAGRRFDEAWNIWFATTEGNAEPVANNAIPIEQARLFLARGDPAAAIDRLAKMARPKSTDPMPLYVDEVTAKILVSQALLAQRNVAEARRNAADALEAITASPVRQYFQTLEAEAALRLGQAQQLAGEPNAARASLERAVSLRETNDDASQSPWLAEAQIALADCLIDLGQRDRARALARKAAAIEAAHMELGEQFKAPLRNVVARLSASRHPAPS